MPKLWKMLVLIVKALLFTACGEGQIFEDPSAKATRESSEIHAARTWEFQQTLVPTWVAIQTTVESVPMMETQLVQLNQQNANLRGTIAAITIPPTPQPTQPLAVATEADLSQRSADNYHEVGTANGVDNNGCTLGFNDTFYITGANDPTRIYFTARALNVIAGTRYQVNWMRGANLRYQSDVWVADTNYDETCIYFWIDSNDTPYEGGFWMAELRANDRAVVWTRFAMCEPGVYC